jgi:hypothetical protein
VTAYVVADTTNPPAKRLRRVLQNRDARPGPPGQPIQPRRWAAAANLPLASSRFIKAAMWTADDGGAEVSAAGVRVVVQAFGDQRQDRLQRGCQPLRRRPF